MSLKDLISSLFKFLLMVAGLAAFVMMVLGGINYLTSVGDPGRMEDAKNQIFSAILGLIILLASWMILNTINPQLVELKEPGTAASPTVTPPAPPVVAGNCLEGQTYAVELYPRANYQPQGKPMSCYQPNESEGPFSKKVSSIKITTTIPSPAIKLFDETNFSGRNICFTSSYPDLIKCYITCSSGLGGCLESWSNNILSLQIIPPGNCPRPGITLNQDGTTNYPNEKCAGF